MRKIVALIIALLLIVLSAAPVLANDDSHVTMQGSGKVVFGETDAVFTVHIDTATVIVRMQAVFPRGVTMPDGQFITGVYWEGEVTVHKIADDTVTVDCLVTAYTLPWHEPVSEQYKLPVEGFLTGPGKRCNIVVGDLGGKPGMGYLTIPGTIIIR